MSTRSNQNEGLRVLEDFVCEAIPGPLRSASRQLAGGITSQDRKPAQTFQNDADYQRWLAEHPEGFVVNTPRGLPSSNMVLHRARCPYISEPVHEKEPGGFTERDYIKVAAVDIAALREWTTTHGRHDATFSKECSVCKPCAELP